VTNHDTDWLAQRFEEHRTRLTAVAHRMLGSASEADDAVQEAWLRLSRSDADSIENLGSWLTTVLSPAERVAFVLHDMFGVPFEEIAPLVGRKPRGEQAPARQAGRRLPRRCPQRRIRPAARPPRPRCRSQGGPDSGADGRAQEIHGAAEVAEFSRRERGATPALLSGAAAAVWMVGGQPRVVYSFTISGEKITAIDLIADPARLRQLDLVIASD
jgi:hypothetical protein